MDKVYGQHGDVVFKIADKLPKGFKGKKAHHGFIIEKGEGIHTHTIVDGDCDVEVIDGTMWLRVNKTTKIDHEEHKIRTLEPGIYRKEIEQEFDYESMEARKTID